MTFFEDFAKGIGTSLKIMHAVGRAMRNVTKGIASEVEKDFVRALENVIQENERANTPENERQEESK